MRKPDDEFINQFWEKYGDLFLSYQGEKETGGVQFVVSDPVLPVSYVKGYEPIDTAPTDEANTGQTSGRESGYSKHHSFHATDSSSPMSDVKKRETIHDRNLSRPSGVFYNNEGDIPSPFFQWNANISPILDKQVRSIPQSFWNAFDCVTPLAEPQGCLHGNTHFEQVDAISTTLVHHDFEYAALDGVDQDIFTCCSKQSDPIFDLATPKAQVNEKFRYNVTLQAPTAMRQHGNEKPVTYLNMGQPYRLTVADSTPSQRKTGAFEYRTFVHVSFEGEDQRSNPVASWQLWKESRGLKEAHERKGKVLAVKFIHPSQGDARNQGQCQVQMGRSSVNGFCVTWTADPTANVYEAAIVLKFHFVSTDFTRSKGVKGVPVRLCAKTEMLGSDDGNRAMMNEPEMCYSVVKLFRDHGAERKAWNDKIRMEKRVEKLNNKIIHREANSNFARRCDNNSAINGERFDIPPQKKRKPSITPRESPTSDEVLRAELATTAEALSSSRPVTVLGLRGNMKDGLLEDQQSTGAIPLAPEGAAHLFKIADVQVDSHSSGCQERPPKDLAGTSGSSPPPANHSPKSVACFYVLFTQGGKQPQGTYYAIYLAGRTFLNLKIELAGKLQIDPCLITRIIWANSIGLKVVVDDDVVLQLPEGQIMIASILELLHKETAPSSAKRSEVEVELVF